MLVTSTQPYVFPPVDVENDSGYTVSRPGFVSGVTEI